MVPEVRNTADIPNPLGTHIGKGNLGVPYFVMTTGCDSCSIQSRLVNP